MGAIPGEAFAVAHLSNLLANRGDYAGAIALSEEGIKREPANASHYMNLAHFNIQIKRHQTALRNQGLAESTVVTNLKRRLAFDQPEERSQCCFHASGVGLRRVGEPERIRRFT